MKITALIPHFWEERRKNLPQIIEALKGGSLPPDEIIIINNNPDYQLDFKSAKVINMDKNYGPKIKHALSLAMDSDWFLSHDDDLIVQEHTLKNMMSYVDFSDCIGLIGKKFNPLKEQTYKSARHIVSADIDCPHYVDVVVGRIHLFNALAAAKGFLRREMLDIKGELVEEDDIFVSMHNKSAVIPTLEGMEFVDLDDGGTGLSYRDNHFENRDKLVDMLRSSELIS